LVAVVVVVAVVVAVVVVRVWFVANSKTKLITEHNPPHPTSPPLPGPQQLNALLAKTYAGSGGDGWHALSPAAGTAAGDADVALLRRCLVVAAEAPGSGGLDDCVYHAAREFHRLFHVKPAALLAKHPPGKVCA